MNSAVNLLICSHFPSITIEVISRQRDTLDRKQLSNYTLLVAGFARKPRGPASAMERQQQAVDLRVQGVGLCNHVLCPLSCIGHCGCGYGRREGAPAQPKV